MTFINTVLQHVFTVLEELQKYCDFNTKCRTTLAKLELTSSITA